MPETIVDKTEAKAEVKPKPRFCAMCFYPIREVRKANQLDEFTDPAITRRASVARVLALPPKSVTTGLAPECKLIPVFPGVWLGYETQDLLAVLDLPVNKFYQDVFEVFIPTQFDDSEELKYIHFDEKTALKLVKNTLHEDWVKNWAIGENRSTVLKAVNDQLVIIAKQREKDKAS